MPKIDIIRFANNLHAAKEAPTLEPYPVCEYVLRNIYEPLLQGKQVLFTDLDFNAFHEGDIDDLEQRADEEYQMTYKLEKVNRTFCDAVPASLCQRTFC